MPNGVGNGSKWASIIGTLVAFLLSAVLAILAYENGRIDSISKDLDQMRTRQALIEGQVLTRLDVLDATAERIERNLQERRREP
jgi:hypothetical protein